MAQVAYMKMAKADNSQMADNTCRDIGGDAAAANIAMMAASEMCADTKSCLHETKSTTP